MNRYYVLSGVLITMHIFFSCAEEEKGLSVNAQVNFIPSISYPVATRAFDGSWEDEDRIGIYMVPHVSDPSDPVDFSVYTSDANVPYRASTGGTSTPLVAVNYGIGYPANNDAVNFVGYYPYQSILHSVENDIYKINVATQSPARDIDLLYHKGTEIPYQGSTASNVSLEFEHQLSKLVISIEPASAEVAVDLSAATVSLTGFPTTASFDLSTGTLSNWGGADVVLTPVKDVDGSSVDKVIFTALLVPHADGSSYSTRTIRVTIEDEDYDYILPANHPFAPGLVYNYKFEFTDGKLALMINVDRDNIELPGDINKGTTTVIGNTIAISTTSTDILESHLSDEKNTITLSKPDWIKTTLSPGPAGTDGWTNYELSFEAESNPNNTYRTGYIHLVVDGLTKVVRVNQGIAKANIANSYMVTPGGSVIIPIERAMTISGMGPDESFTIENLWDDNNVYDGYTISGTGRDREITVTTNNALGNALIALKHDGVVYWSWHIWVTDYNGSATWTNNGYEMMDRNMGAIAAENSLDGRGLYYQWGRKDPTPGTGTAGAGLFKFVLRPKEVGSNSWDYFRNHLLYAIQNPDMYIQELAQYGNGYGWYWPNYDASDYLWKTEDSKKTMYDPCPAGWKVPMTTDPWKDASGTIIFAKGPNAGIDYGTNGLFPVTGVRRLAFSGVLEIWNPDSSGYYWCGNNSKRTFWFSSNYVALSGNEPPAAAMAVRCIKE